jgi:succinate dehydrogenase / fumarate reductase cytochrome b subunit
MIVIPKVSLYNSIVQMSHKKGTLLMNCWKEGVFMGHKRPMNLDLRTIKFPITAIVSILHRISGLLVFLFIPVFLWGLQKSLRSVDDFAAVTQFFNNPFLKFIIWGFLAALIYHLLAGIRHLFMDMQIGETLKGGKLGAKIVIVFATLLIVLAGWWIW